ncbi:hypothetical protein [uncultured Clostridium sp.]|uniref:hypothetical protein n=1 Tax=uncultured Clostridium sp. TaxID=59620 RepID=UPI0025ECE1E4|nr:hypothetical protein [uncultured Clostridium sp.]
MNNVFQFIKKLGVFLILFLAPIAVIAVFAVKEYALEQIDLSAGDWAGLWGSAFVYWGTVILGTLAFWQNTQVQENNDLLINFEKNKVAPVFSLLLEGYQGMLQKLKFKLTNCSDNLACNLNVSDLEIHKITVQGDSVFISRTPIVNSDKISILETHSHINLEYNNSVTRANGEMILLIIKITASDIIGLTRTTIVNIYIGDSLKCKYEYKIEHITGA